ncbi:unnamed protein product [Angiostrongylus costaricensis]|uniref:RRM domain-containing protein n=1 Tax=Angiostrongylus costaricensis TaxID=334426 RepID=A0A0R3PP91_ANGCS|nr:unnamed protein product [Angiostrongylus costaricensis]
MSGVRERTCYVSNLPPFVTADTIEEFFKGVGIIESVTLIERISYRFAFVVFESTLSVPHAITRLHRTKLHGVPVSVQPHRGSKKLEQVRYLVDTYKRREPDDCSGDCGYEREKKRRRTLTEHNDEHCQSSPDPTESNDEPFCCNTAPKSSAQLDTPRRPACSSALGFPS